VCNLRCEKDKCQGANSELAASCRHRVRMYSLRKRRYFCLARRIVRSLLLEDGDLLRSTSIGAVSLQYHKVGDESQLNDRESLIQQLAGYDANLEV